MRREVIGDCELYLGDCRDILPSLGEIDAVITDPPYGIGAGAKSFQSGTREHAPAYSFGDWDAERPDLARFLLVGRYHLFWGGQYFANKLPQADGWLTWCKRPLSFDFSADRRSYATTELAWRNWGKAKFMALVWDGIRREGDASNRSFCHPTQKPIEVMEWCVRELPEDAKIVLDPFMGSGTTGVACVKLGRRFIGIEIEPSYFDTARRRIEEAMRQPDLFIEAPSKPTQISIEFSELDVQ